MTSEGTTDQISFSLRDMRKFLRFLAWGLGVGFCGAAGVVAGFEVFTHQKDWSAGYLSALAYSTSFCANLTAASIVFIITDIWFFRKLKSAEQTSQKEEIITQLSSVVGEQLKGLAHIGIIEHQNVRLAPWTREIRNATAIDLFVQGWVYWVEERRDVLKEFFERGGVFNLFLPDPGLSTLIEPMARRLNRDLLRQQTEINETRTLLEKCCKDTRGKLNIFLLRDMMWYCAVRFDERTLFLSLYEHIRGDRIESPTYEVPLDGRHQHTKAWIEKEFNGLKPNDPYPV